VIAHLGEVSRVVAKPLMPEEARELEALVARRRQLVQMRTAEMNRCHQAMEVVRRRIDRVIAILEEELADIDTDLRPDFDNRLCGGIARTFYAVCREWAPT